MSETRLETALESTVAIAKQPRDGAGPDAGPVAPFYGQARTRGAGSHLYYRMPDGWIHAQPAGRAIDGEFQNARKLERQGWEPLWRYGRFDFLPYHVEHEFEWLFQAGGARELPLD